MKNKKTKPLIWIGIGLIAISLIYIFYSKEATTQITADFIKVKKGVVTIAVTATGTIQPIKQVQVGTQVSGVVEKIYVDYNSVVKAGQLIAELDKTNLNATLSQQQATYNNAVNNRDYQQNIYNRQKVLYENQVISKADYDEALYQLNDAKNAVTERLSDLQKARTNLSYANIYSPIDGVILSRAVDEGQTVAASLSTPTLFTISKDLKEMQVEADVDEADIGQVKEGQRVAFTVDAYQGEEFSGVVTQVRLNPTTTANVVTYTVVVKADNPELKLKPGLTATISIFIIELKDVETIEVKAVNFKPDPQLMMAYNSMDKSQNTTPPPPLNKMDNEDDGTIVWMRVSGIIKPVKVVLGTSDGINIEVLKGLNEGDELAYQLKSGNIEEVSTKAKDSESPFMPPRPKGAGGPPR